MIKKDIAKKVSLFLTHECCYEGVKIKFLYLTKIEPERWSVGYKKTVGDNWDTAPVAHRFINESELIKYEK